MIAVIFLLIQLGFAAFILFLTVAFVTGAPFVPSTKPTADAMIALANVKPGMKIYDLGSGDGRLLLMAAKKGATAVGLEINPFLVVFSWLKIFFFNLARRDLAKKKAVTVHWQNFWGVDLSDADVVFVYLLPWKMEALAKKLARELKPGTLIVSNSFIFPTWKILRRDEKTHAYVFRV